MPSDDSLRVRVTMFIEAPPAEVYAAFVEPARLTKFWISKASGPLRLGEEVQWSFMVEGAEAGTTATTMNEGKTLAWTWSDNTKVEIDFEALDGGTAVTLINDGFAERGQERVDVALNATEGFAIVLADLKTFLETGKSAGITKAKAKLIALRR